ncbi:MAG: mannose-1-phosphate guanylyltransferase/mannose-6-phosphate isomerase [Alphaproteobacteria bacterium]|nr:mannose-1-phosphate guanylyltransferase/mannose-6-phosphate isomerase [Alphaproteobacteria bacterium]
MKILPVILSGGSGTRLWPVSRSDYPKQLQRLVGTASLLQQTAQRLSQNKTVLPPLVLCSDSQRFLVAEQLREVGIAPSALVLEPVPRSTAPALAAAALWVKDPQNTILVAMPADHFIADQAAFAQAIDKAAQAAEQGLLMTLGIKPIHPHTGFGYIERGDPVNEAEGIFEAKRFKEKPDEATAQSYIEAGTFFWNAGIFVFRADIFLEEIGKYHPEIVKACRAALDAGKTDLDFLRLDKETFAQAPDISVDYAVMEKSARVGILPVSFKWSDIGGWPALWAIGQKDGKGNVIEGDVLLKDTAQSYIRSDGRLVAAIGLNNMVIVDTADALLVAAKDRADEVKDLVTQLKKAGRPECREHAQVWRPWGFYESLAQGPRFQVKKIMVKPGGKLSLQKHLRRAEHWIVVNGTAKVQIDDKTLHIGPNESTDIPLGAVHRLENYGSEPLYLIEVQSGDYFGEDDIIRLEDAYRRV